VERIFVSLHRLIRCLRVDHLACQASKQLTTYMVCMGKQGMSGHQQPFTCLGGDVVKDIVPYLRLCENGNLSRCNTTLLMDVSFKLVDKVEGPYRSPVHVIDNLYKFEKLGVLDFTNANFGYEGAGKLANVLPGMHHLKELLLGGNTIGVLGIRALSIVFKSDIFHSQLEVLALQDNDVGQYGASYVADAIKYSKALQSLTSLDLSSNNVRKAGAAALLDAFTMGCPNIKHLYLAKNGYLGVEVMTKLAESWNAGAMPKLETLHVADSRVFLAGVRTLARGLQRLVTQHLGYMSTPTTYK